MPPPAPGPPSAPGTPPITGRESELAALRGSVSALAAGRGGVAWIEGEPGIGKSTLVRALAAAASARGFAVYRAAGDELGRRLPLRALLDGLDADAAEAAATLDRRDHDGADGALPAAVERLRSAIARLCAIAPVVLIFDDLQWADEASLLAWHRLGASAHQVPLLLVSACRPVPVRPTVAELRRGLLRRGAALVSLGPLAGDDIAGLAGRLAGATAGPRLREALAQTGGNPRYAGELLAALVRERRVRVGGGVAELAGSAGDVPASLGRAILPRLDFLSAGAIPTLRIAALLGSEFSVFDLVTVTSEPIGALLPVLDEAVAAGVLVEADDRLRFRHGLVRQALYEALPASARSALHRHAARALADAGLPVDRVAGHLAAAPDAVDGWAVDWLSTYAEALADHAPGLAAELLVQAARRSAGDDPRGEHVLCGLATALCRLKRLDEAEAVARHVLAASTDPVRAAESGWVLGATLHAAGRYEEAVAALDAALARDGAPATWRARLRAWRATVLTYAGRRAEGADDARSALAEGERLADRRTIGQAFYTLHLLADHETGLSHVDRALSVIGDRPESTDLRISLLGNRAYILDALGRHEPATAALAEALAERLDPARLSAVRAQAAARLIAQGRWDEAWARLESLPGDLGFVERLVRLGGLAFVAAHRDDRGACEAFLRSVDDLPPVAGLIRGNATLLYLARAVDAEQRDGPAAAAALLASTVADGDREDLYERDRWLPDLVRLALAAGDRDLARAAVAAVEADAAAEPLPRRVAAARQARAVLDGDVEALVSVAAQYRASAPLAYGQTREEAAALLARAGDVTAARAALTDAVRAYLDLGAGWDVRRADARLRRFGVRRGPRTIRRRPTAGWEALTPTEERVAALVARGRSNPEIAAEMLLSRRTVQAHVSNILAKLGYGSRLEIAREATRRDRL